MRLGAYDAILKSNSKVSKIYNAPSISERHRHRFEVDINYKEILEKNGFIFSGFHLTVCYQKLLKFLIIHGS